MRLVGNCGNRGRAWAFKKAALSTYWYFNSHDKSSEKFPRMNPLQNESWLQFSNYHTAATFTRFMTDPGECRRSEHRERRREELAEALRGAPAQTAPQHRAAAPVPGNPGPPPPAPAPASRPSAPAAGAAAAPPGPGPSPRPGRTQPRSRRRGAERSAAHVRKQRLRADLEADERPRRVPAEGAGRGAGWRSFRAFAWVAGRPAALGARPCPAPPRAMLLPSDVARLVLGE